jgi:hypothetical protein
MDELFGATEYLTKEASSDPVEPREATETKPKVETREATV